MTLKFPELAGGPVQGLNDAGVENFQGAIDVYLSRECGQNTGDAPGAGVRLDQVGCPLDDGGLFEAALPDLMRERPEVADRILTPAESKLEQAQRRDGVRDDRAHLGRRDLARADGVRSTVSRAPVRGFDSG